MEIMPHVPAHFPESPTAIPYFPMREPGPCRPAVFQRAFVRPIHPMVGVHMPKDAVRDALQVSQRYGSFSVSSKFAAMVSRKYFRSANSPCFPTLKEVVGR